MINFMLQAAVRIVPILFAVAIQVLYVKMRWWTSFLFVFLSFRITTVILFLFCLFYRPVLLFWIAQNAIKHSTHQAKRKFNAYSWLLGRLSCMRLTWILSWKYLLSSCFYSQGTNDFHIKRTQSNRKFCKSYEYFLIFFLFTEHRSNLLHWRFYRSFRLAYNENKRSRVHRICYQTNKRKVSKCSSCHGNWKPRHSSIWCVSHSSISLKLFLSLAKNFRKFFKTKMKNRNYTLGMLLEI